jgi:predicted ArsR family transcriptional regulator
MSWVEKLIGETQANLLRLLRRSQQTITGLAQSLGLTDNAVRTHIAALGRDGLVSQVGTQRDTGGKPARVYALTDAGEELFPKAYAPILAALVEEITRSEGPERALELLRAVGRDVGASVTAPEDLPGRVAAAAGVLRSLGGDIEARATGPGWRLQGFGCPLSQVTAKHPEVCELVRSLVEHVTRVPVTECCEHGSRPRCAFELR